MNSVTNQKHSISKYRNNLPQLTERLFLTDGGLETTLIFHEGVTLPYFGAFHLLKDAAGTEILRRYFKRYVNPRLQTRPRRCTRKSNLAGES
jgi:S-methylmethionine-dependent homocysteine/selenocysteine methylase